MPYVHQEKKGAECLFFGEAKVMIQTADSLFKYFTHYVFSLDFFPAFVEIWWLKY